MTQIDQMTSCPLIKNNESQGHTPGDTFKRLQSKISIVHIGYIDDIGWNYIIKNDLGIYSGSTRYLNFSDCMSDCISLLSPDETLWDWVNDLPWYNGDSTAIELFLSFEVYTIHGIVDRIKTNMGDIYYRDK